jgi:hypothetical protein
MATTEVRVTDGESDAPDHPGANRGRRRRRWFPWIAGLVLVASALGYLVGNEVQANTQFDQAHHSLDAVRHGIAGVSLDLATVRRDLDVVNGLVAVGSSTLANDTSKLVGARDALATAQADVSRQTSAITSLHACLAGVEQALNALSLADQSSAINALNAVSASCASVVGGNG